MQREHERLGDVERFGDGFAERAGDFVLEGFGQRREHRADERADAPGAAEQFRFDAGVEVADEIHRAAILDAHQQRTQLQIVRPHHAVGNGKRCVARARASAAEVRINHIQHRREHAERRDFPEQPVAQRHVAVAVPRHDVFGVGVRHVQASADAAVHLIGFADHVHEHGAEVGVGRGEIEAVIRAVAPGEIKIQTAGQRAGVKLRLQIGHERRLIAPNHVAGNFLRVQFPPMKIRAGHAERDVRAMLVIHREPAVAACARGGIKLIRLQNLRRFHTDGATECLRIHHAHAVRDEDGVRRHVHAHAVRRRCAFGANRQRRGQMHEQVRVVEPRGEADHLFAAVGEVGDGHRAARTEAVVIAPASPHFNIQMRRVGKFHQVERVLALVIEQRCEGGEIKLALQPPEIILRAVVRPMRGVQHAVAAREREVGQRPDVIGKTDVRARRRHRHAAKRRRADGEVAVEPQGFERIGQIHRAVEFDRWRFLPTEFTDPVRRFFAQPRTDFLQIKIRSAVKSRVAGDGIERSGDVEMAVGKASLDVGKQLVRAGRAAERHARVGELAPRRERVGEGGVGGDFRARPVAGVGGNGESHISGLRELDAGEGVGELAELGGEFFPDGGRGVGGRRGRRFFGAQFRGVGERAVEVEI